MYDIREEDAKTNPKTQLGSMQTTWQMFNVDPVLELLEDTFVELGDLQRRVDKKIHKLARDTEREEALYQKKLTTLRRSFDVPCLLSLFFLYLSLYLSLYIYIHLPILWISLDLN